MKGRRINLKTDHAATRQSGLDSQETCPRDIRADETAIDVGTARPLFKTQFRSATLAYAVTADGRFLVNRAVDDDRPMPIMLVVNWFGMLRK